MNEQVCHGESDGANLAGVEVARADIRMVLADVNPDLIYNFDETGLFFPQLPRRSLIK